MSPEVFKQGLSKTEGIKVTKTGFTLEADFLMTLYCGDKGQLVIRRVRSGHWKGELLVLEVKEGASTFFVDAESVFAFSLDSSQKSDERKTGF